MGVQTQIDRISDEVSAQAQLITQIQNALEGKAAGGGSGGASVETCNVSIDFSAMLYCAEYSASVYVGDTVNTIVSGLTPESPTVTISGVLCGSCIAIYYSGYSFPGFSLSGLERVFRDVDLENYYNTSRYYKVTAAAGETATISVYNGD